MLLMTFRRSGRMVLLTIPRFQLPFGGIVPIYFHARPVLQMPSGQPEACLQHNRVAQGVGFLEPHGLRRNEELRLDTPAVFFGVFEGALHFLV